jgi:ubiquinone/menaquinone biosynthesis C-methylase UbiE
MSSRISDQVDEYLAKVAPGMLALAICEGDGNIAFALANAIQPSGHLTLMVPDPIQLSAFAERASLLGLTNLTLRIFPGFDLPFPDGTFDRAWREIRPGATGSFDQVLSETRRVLKPGGLAFIVMLPPTNADLSPPEKPDERIVLDYLAS